MYTPNDFKGKEKQPNVLYLALYAVVEHADDPSGNRGQVNRHQLESCLFSLQELKIKQIVYDTSLRVCGCKSNTLEKCSLSKDSTDILQRRSSRQRAFTLTHAAQTTRINLYKFISLRLRNWLPRQKSTVRQSAVELTKRYPYEITMSLHIARYFLALQRLPGACHTLALPAPSPSFSAALQTVQQTACLDHYPL